MIESFKDIWFSNGRADDKDDRNVKLHAVKAGPPNGRLAILLHGFPEFWYSWRKQIPALAAAGLHICPAFPPRCRLTAEIVLYLFLH